MIVTLALAAMAQVDSILAHENAAAELAVIEFAA
jgi:hypothetical protein